MRVLLLTGSGGAGTSTVAAATLAWARSRGVKAGLFDANADSRRSVTAYRWDDVLAAAAALTGCATPAGLEAAAMPAPPLAERVAVLLGLRERLRTGWEDLLVVDLPPLAESLALLTLPQTIAAWTDAAAPVEQRVARAVSAARPGPQPAGLGAIDRLREDLDELQREITGQQTSVRLVVRPDPGAVDAALAALPALSLAGLRVDAVVAGLLVPEGTDRWLAAVGRAQRAQVERLSACGLPVERLHREAEAPSGAAALRVLGRRLCGPDPVAPCSVPAPLRVEPEGDGYVLRLALPLAQREDVSLVRDGDHLVVGVGGHRRRLGLPSALRRCAVAGASLRGGELRVRLVPDPDLWRIT